MCFSIFAETSRHEKISPIYFRELNRGLQLIETTLTQSKHGKSRTFERQRVRILQKRQIIPALPHQHLGNLIFGGGKNHCHIIARSLRE